MRRPLPDSNLDVLLTVENAVGEIGCGRSQLRGWTVLTKLEQVLNCVVS